MMWRNTCKYVQLTEIKKKDFTEVNDLFPKEDQTGIEQIVLYQGIHIKRYYDTEKEKYEIIR